jgi:hypothetical protein
MIRPPMVRIPQNLHITNLVLDKRLNGRTFGARYSRIANGKSNRYVLIYSMRITLLVGCYSSS